MFVAAHALQIGEEIYLVPSDAQLEEGDHFQESVESTCVKLRDIATKVTKTLDESKKALCTSGSKQERCMCIFILDACRAKGFLNGANAPNVQSTEAFTRSHDMDNSFCDQIFMFSTWREDKSSDGQVLDGHSPCTKALMKHLFVEGKQLQEALTQVATDMYAETVSNANHPWVRACEAKYTLPNCVQLDHGGWW